VIALRGAARVALALTCALVACAEPPVAEPPTPLGASAPVRAPMAFEVDPQASLRIRADVTYLASPELAGRGTGEPGGKLAAEFVDERFRELGLAPLGDASSSSYLQLFRARIGARAAVPEIGWAGKARALTTKEADWTGSIATADGSASGTARGEPTFASYGISAPALAWDDYAVTPVTGRIVFVLDGAPTLARDGRDDALHDYRSVRYKIRTAREHGASGVVIVAPGAHVDSALGDASDMGIPAVVVTSRLAEVLLLPNADALAHPQRHVSRFDQPFILAPTAPWAGKAPLTTRVMEFTTRVEPVDAPSWNVVGELAPRPGSPSAGEYVVVGAHYDHLGHGGTSASRAPGSREIHPGADDNASGVALMLEVARAFTRLPRRPDRGVVFVAFGAEELGVLGSRWFVDHPPLPLDRDVAMINADMVGRLRDGVVVVDGTGTAKEWPDLEAGAARGLALHVVAGSEGFGASDHTNFTAARVPTAFFFTGAHEDYHRPSDTADKINAEGEARIATMAARLALAVAQAPARLEFVDAPADPHRGMRGGFKVSLGTLPDYAFTGRGVKLTGARADSPAARAGLRAGDVIVKVGPHDIGNIHDYMFALGDLEAGREVIVEVERDGRRVSMKVVPAPPR
jgi:hypothetical protein